MLVAGRSLARHGGPRKMSGLRACAGQAALHGALAGLDAAGFGLPGCRRPRWSAASHQRRHATYATTAHPVRRDRCSKLTETRGSRTDARREAVTMPERERIRS